MYTAKWTLEFHNERGISWLAERLLFHLGKVCSAQKWNTKSCNIFRGVYCIYNYSVGKWSGSVTFFQISVPRNRNIHKSNHVFVSLKRVTLDICCHITNESSGFQFIPKYLKKYWLRSYIDISKHNLLIKIPKIYEYSYWVISSVRSEFKKLIYLINRTVPLGVC
jgi:hypothetical protein